ncbi:hypothetical protein GCM10027610_061210 [Dactylosporangium cerinum]
MAAGGLVNAVWDLAARRAGQPLWKLLADLTPEQLVAQIDFRYLRDALTEDEALALLRAPPAAGRPGSGSCWSAAIRRTPRRRAGSATTTRSSPGCAGKPSTPVMS